MKQTPTEDRILERMTRGVLSRGGFLGDDPRPLAEILDTDECLHIALRALKGRWGMFTSQAHQARSIS